MKRLLLILSAMACGESSDAAAPADTTDPADTVADVVDAAEAPLTGSYYDFTVAFANSKLQQRYKGELLPEKVSFGCTHIAPAKSLAVTFTYATPFSVLSLNLGFVVASDAHPLTIEGPGVYAWGKGATNAPPAFDIVVTEAGGPQLTLASWTEGAEGTVSILGWGTTGGEVVEGRISGTLVNDGPFDAKAQIQGEFRIELPPEAGCGG